ncbi:hypothetical protein O0I10_012288 [Lichtheimia ornata]|uniref:Integrase catalytic domain-containing protein n=1 Tax=Lichtheimia ornata TaxID=688661 RepID=A0AAD7XPQ2_9FUNG|nr:uncharacterized protein O0I10_012288 [Lichtheimia ornata]KAJ8652099.1 hypothetical protein O0I10_012288 [Lichtheimia ornata]
MKSLLFLQTPQTSVEHPQGDGLVERMNRTVKTALATQIEQDPKNWDAYLPMITFSINTAVQASIGVSPFEAMFGRKPTLPATAELTPSTTEGYNTKEWIHYLNSHLPLIHGNIKKKLTTAQERQKKYYDDKRQESSKYEIGDKVLKLLSKERWTFGSPKWTGPWIITGFRNKDKTSFELKHTSADTLKKNQQHTTAHVSQVHKVIESTL